MQQNHFKANPLVTGIKAALLGSSTALVIASMPAFANDIEELKAQINALQSRLEQLEQQQVAIVPVPTEKAEMQSTSLEQLESRIGDETIIPANVVTNGDKPGTFKLSGSDTSVRIGGYVKGDFIYNFDQSLGDTLAASAINVGDNTPDGPDKVRLHAKQSRFLVQTTTPSDFGELKTHLEVDLFNGEGSQTVSNSSGFRLRQAYASMGGLLVGQAWSNFTQFDAYPDTIDFAGPAGLVFARQGQIRYTTALGDYTGAVSIENPEGKGFAGSQDPAPDLTASLKGNLGPASFTLAGLARFLEYDDGVNSDDTFAWGLNFGTSIKFGQANLMLALAGGSGIGRYLYYGFDNDAYINADGKLEPLEAYGGGAALGYSWSDTLSSQIAWGYYKVDDENYQYRLAHSSNSTYESISTVHLTLFNWSPAPKTSIGLEFSWAELENFEDQSGDSSRLQFSMQRSF